jgi:hypothetical protein
MQANEAGGNSMLHQSVRDYTVEQGLQCRICYSWYYSVGFVSRVYSIGLVGWIYCIGLVGRVYSIGFVGWIYCIGLVGRILQYRICGLDLLHRISGQGLQ